MQLDPNKPLVHQLRKFTSSSLECLVAATCASVGYTVFRNLKVEEDGATVAEADVLASTFLPLREQRILIECKGGVPTFEDLRKAASWQYLLDPSPDEIIVLGRGPIAARLTTIAAKVGVSLIDTQNLRYYVLPFLAVQSLRQRARDLNRYLAWQMIHEYLIDFVPSHPGLKQHYRFLTVDLWKLQDPFYQMGQSYEGYSTYKDISNDVALSLNTTAYAAASDAAHDLVEASFYVMWLHRLINVYSVVRATLTVMRQRDTIFVLNNMGVSLRNGVSALSEQPRYMHGYPGFLQTYLFVWGGFLTTARRDAEIEQLALETGVTPQAVRHYLRVTDAIFSGGLQTKLKNIEGFVYVPGALRSLGILHRQSIDRSYLNIPFFAKDANYHSALDRALTTIGGATGLVF